MITRPRSTLIASALALASAAWCASCDDHKSASGRDAGLTEPSPNASILPAPLASGIEAPSNGKSAGSEPERRDAGHWSSDAGSDVTPPEPRYLRENQALSPESPHETSGLSLTARLRWLDVAPAPRMPEQNLDGLARARDAVGFDLLIDLAGGRMRFAFASQAFTLPQGSQLHARDDLYGYALLWPNRRTYTVIAPGALRSVLAQQRADVVPLVRARLTKLTGGTQFSFATERAELSTPTGKLELEQVRAPDPMLTNSNWASGVSLCHLLVEWVGAAPTSPACRADLVPTRAVFTWPNGEHFAFEVARLQRRADLNPSALAMPPADAEFRPSELPTPPPSALLSDNELTEFRLRTAQRSQRIEAAAPKAGLLLVNHGESLRYASIDGVLTARLTPGAEQLLPSLRPGKYQVTLRDFFGAEDTFSRIVEVPARLSLGDDTEKSH